MRDPFLLRCVLAMRCVGFTYAQIASVTGLSVSTVQKILRQFPEVVEAYAKMDDETKVVVALKSLGYSYKEISSFTKLPYERVRSCDPAFRAVESAVSSKLNEPIRERVAKYLLAKAGYEVGAIDDGQPPVVSLGKFSKEGREYVVRVYGATYEEVAERVKEAVGKYRKVRRLSLNVDGRRVTVRVESRRVKKVIEYGDYTIRVVGGDPERFEQLLRKRDFSETFENLLGNSKRALHRFELDGETFHVILSRKVRSVLVEYRGLKLRLRGVHADKVAELMKTATPVFVSSSRQVSLEEASKRRVLVVSCGGFSTVAYVLRRS